ncbi:MAG: hypothetical protein V1839_01945 [archaeon]
MADFILRMSDGMNYQLSYNPKFNRELQKDTGGWTLTNMRTKLTTAVKYPLGSVSIGDKFTVISPGIMGKPPTIRALKVDGIIQVKL